MNLLEAATFADALDGFGAGLFLVGKTGRIIHANASGHAMLRGRSVLREGNDWLVPCEVYGATALKELFAFVGGGDGGFGAKPIAVPLSTRDGNNYVAHSRRSNAPKSRRPLLPARIPWTAGQGAFLRDFNEAMRLTARRSVSSFPQGSGGR